MYVRIPFEVAPEGVENANKARFEIFGLVHVEKHSVNDVANGEKQAI